MHSSPRFATSMGLWSKLSLLFFNISIVACLGDEGDIDQTEDLTIVVEADKSRIQAEETALRKQQDSMEGERERLEREKSEVAQRLSSLSKKDKKQRVALEADLERLRKDERKILDRFRQVEGERAKLSSEKDKLLDRISRMTATKGGLTVAQREELMAQREKTVAKREAALAAREARVAERESKVLLSLKQAEDFVGVLSQSAAGKTVIVNQPTNAVSAKVSGATRSSAQNAKTKLESSIRRKGLLLSDLPTGFSTTVSQAKTFLSKKRYNESVEAYAQAQAAVDGIRVNRAFVQAKMGRLSRDFPSLSKNSKLSSALSGLNELTVDGQWSKANQKINQIIALVKR